MKRMALDWNRVAGVLGAREGDDDVACAYCAARGSVPYIAEHVVATHPTTQHGKRIARLVLESQKRPRPA